MTLKLYSKYLSLFKYIDNKLTASSLMRNEMYFISTQIKPIVEEKILMIRSAVHFEVINAVNLNGVL